MGRSTRHMAAQRLAMPPNDRSREKSATLLETVLGLGDRFGRKHIRQHGRDFGE